MATAIRMVGHEDRLTLVDHLEELRTRLIVSVAVLAVAFGICLWQNHELLHIMNKPLQTETKRQVANGVGTVGQANLAQQGLLKTAQDMQALVGLLAKPGSGLSKGVREQLPPLSSALKADVAKLPRKTVGISPVTTGIAEPFTTTITVTLYFALIVSLPVILFELYGFILPALEPHERRIAMPLLSAVPFLFAAGVAFGYFVVLPAAVRFFANFNASDFNVLVQASPLYSFESTILLAMGLVFQVPVVVLGATRLGIVTPRQLRRGRPFAFAACAAVAAFLPGDAITLLLETVPLYLLYEMSILIAALVGRANRVRPEEGSAATAGPGHPGEGPGPQPPEHPADSTVQDLIDHIDPRLSGK
ncbi:MAG TPA: twin-arginine translocase subunit TatC [Solirubrobacteraceae bacterium]|jgi:sec-independent protein translocase protein TatC|nr:twin-arginine translocase subunit TatC [Solirubrobacteraceae bacterium]